MPRPDLVALLAANLHHLPGPDGKLYKLPHHSTIGQPPEVAARIRRTNQRMAEAIVRFIEQNGYPLDHVNDPRPEDAPGGKIGYVTCAHCAEPLLKLALEPKPIGDKNPNYDLVAQLVRGTIEQIGHPHACWAPAE